MILIGKFSTCQGCGARILWVQAKTGKPMALNPVPHKSGEVIIVDGLAVLFPVDQPATTVRYRLHTQTCPTMVQIANR